MTKIKIIEDIEGFIAWNKGLEGRKILYRGLADKDWEIEASGYRRLEPPRIQKIFQRSIGKLINDARIRGLGQKNNKDLSDLELLAELQHYGAATCLIDFTANPFVALWFACLGSHQQDGKVIALPTANVQIFSEVTAENLANKIKEFLGTEKIWKWTPPSIQNNRIIAQNSVFLFGPEVINENLYQAITIKKDAKKEIIEALQIYDITESYLFSDFAGFAAINAHDKKYTDYGADDYFELGLSHHQRRDLSTAIEYYDKALALNPQYAEAYNNRGNAKTDLEKYREAIADFDQAIVLNSKDAEAYHNRGVAKIGLEKYRDAIADFDQAIVHNPLIVEAYSNRGYAKTELGLHQDAIADCDQAIAINPQYAGAYTNRGVANAGLGKYQDAIADFDKAIVHSPQNATAYYNRGVAKANLEQHQNAIADFDTAIAINPQYAEAYYNRGGAKVGLGQHQNAIADYDQAIAINSQYAEAYSNRGVAKAELGLHRDAIADFDQAIVFNPQHANAYYNRGGAKAGLRQYQDAIADYDQAIALNPQYAGAYYNRGVARKLLGDAEGADADFATAHGLDSTLPPAD